MVEKVLQSCKEHRMRYGFGQVIPFVESNGARLCVCVCARKCAITFVLLSSNAATLGT